MTLQHRLEGFIQRIWYKGHPLQWLLWPLSLCFYALSRIRKWWLIKQFSSRTPPPVPIVVVGNISVGGSGKSPVVVGIAKALAQAGYHPGIISRGYGGQARSYPILVTPDTHAHEVGDEPFMIFQQTGYPVCVDPNRLRATEYLLGNSDSDLIISDDGLQHYTLPRTIEIAVVNAHTGFGNGLLLPAGPLREPVSRLNTVDFVLSQGASTLSPHSFELRPTRFTNLHRRDHQAIDYFAHQKVHAVAGIAHPKRFFDTLSALNINLIEHAFSDHHDFCYEDLAFGDELPIIMTHKDAVKCGAFDDLNLWILHVEAHFDSDFIPKLRGTLNEQKIT